jgi:hypothetical protein
VRILLDECVPGRLRSALLPYEAVTVPQMGWASIENGALLGLAEGKFDIFLTLDRNIPYQQNIGKFGIALVILRAHGTRLKTLQALVLKHLGEIEAAQPGAVTFISSK